MKNALKIGEHYFLIQTTARTGLFLARLLGKKLAESDGYVFHAWRGKIYISQRGKHDSRTSKTSG